MHKRIFMSLLLFTLSSLATVGYAEDEKKGSVKSEFKGAWSEVKGGSKEVWSGVKKGSKEAWKETKGGAKEVKKESKGVWQSIKDAFKDEE